MTEKLTVEIERGGELLLDGVRTPTGSLVAPSTWKTGRVYDSLRLGRAAVGIAQLHLLNNDRRWDQVQSGDFIRIYIDGEIQWAGYVDKANNLGSQRRTVRHLRCMGALGYMVHTIHIPPQRNVSLQDAMGQIFDACSVPVEYRGTISGSHVFPIFFVDGLSGKEAAHRVEATVVGFLYENLEGQVTLEAYTARTGSGALFDIAQETATSLADSFERRTVGYQGSVVYPVIGAEQVVAELPTDHVDMPISISAGTDFVFVIPNSVADSSGVIDVLPIVASDYTASGTGLTFTVSASGTGVLVSVTNTASVTRNLTSIQVRGKGVIVNPSIVRQVGTLVPGQQYEDVPPHLIQTSGGLSQLLGFLLRVGSEGQQVDRLEWYAGNNRALARTLDISKRLRSVRTDAVYLIEGTDHSFGLGKKHKVMITVTKIAPYSNLFTLDLSLLDGDDLLL